MDTDFFGFENNTFSNGPDAKLNEMIAWMENVNRESNEYMDEEGLEILKENGYISIKKKHIKASMFRGTGKNKEYIQKEIRVKKKLKEDCLSSIVDEVVNKFHECKTGKTELKPVINPNVLCNLPENARTLIYSRVDLNKRMAFVGNGYFTSFWRNRLKKLKLPKPAAGPDETSDPLTESYADWVVAKINTGKPAAVEKQMFLKEAKEKIFEMPAGDKEAAGQILMELVDYTDKFNGGIQNHDLEKLIN